MDSVEIDGEPEMTAGLRIVVDGEHVITVGLSAIDHPEIQMRISSADEIVETKNILLRVATYVVSCHTRLREGDILDLGVRKVQLRGVNSGGLEIEAAPGEDLDPIGS